MPPKVKITGEDIVRAAIDIVRQNGPDAVNARAIAAQLGCSTQPVFSNFSDMEELKQAVMEETHKLYLQFLQTDVESGKYPPYKAFGMAYIRFAREEKELFKLLYLCDRKGQARAVTTDWETSVQMIMQANGISRERAERMHMELWTCVHGIATMSATSFLSLDEELVSTMLSDVYMGLQSRLATQEERK